MDFAKSSATLNLDDSDAESAISSVAMAVILFESKKGGWEGYFYTGKIVARLFWPRTALNGYSRENGKWGYIKIDELHLSSLQKIGNMERGPKAVPPYDAVNDCDWRIWARAKTKAWMESVSCGCLVWRSFELLIETRFIIIHPSSSVIRFEQAQCPPKTIFLLGDMELSLADWIRDDWWNVYFEIYYSLIGTGSKYVIMSYNALNDS